MEFLVAFTVVVTLLYLRGRYKAALRQIQREEAMRKIVKKVIQKRNIDELYGRSGKRKN